MRLIRFLSFVMILFLMSTSIFASSTLTKSLVAGYWVTIDGTTNKPSSIIQVIPDGQFYIGKIVKIFKENHQQSSDICKACQGAQQNKPILGLTIISGMQCSLDACKNGMILDPRDGKLYHATMTLVQNGDALKVHGYVGIPLFGKTVVWYRTKSL